jgi:hypothetical protein
MVFYTRCSTKVLAALWCGVLEWQSPIHELYLPYFLYSK